MRWFKRKKPQGFLCPTCGKVHEGLPTDMGFKLPDVVFALPPEERQAHLDWSTDISCYQDRWYIRGVLEVPFQFDEGRFGWGIWAEVSEETMGRFRAVFETDGSDCPREPGTIANELSFYPGTMGLAVEIQFGRPELRPTFFFRSDIAHQMADEQRSGLTTERYHELVATIT